MRVHGECTASARRVQAWRPPEAFWLLGPLLCTPKEAQAHQEATASTPVPPPGLSSLSPCLSQVPRGMQPKYLRFEASEADYKVDCYVARFEPK